MERNASKFEAPALMTDGICELEHPFPAATIERWNTGLDPLFKEKHDEPRWEIDGPVLYRLGIFEGFFSDKIRSIVRGVMPDATLWDFHAYEIAGGQERPHIAAEQFDGWHADILPLPGMDMRVPHFISIFVYLTDVDDGDGPFEFLPLSSQDDLESGLPSVKVFGLRGTTFIWNKSFYHRASPNRGSTRRRVLKVSFHRNYFESVVLASDWVEELKREVGDRDEFLAYLLGKYHQATHLGQHLLPDVPPSRVGSFRLTANSTIERFGLKDELRLRAKRLLGPSV